MHDCASSPLKGRTKRVVGIPSRRLAPRDPNGAKHHDAATDMRRKPESRAPCTGGDAASDHRQGSGELMFTALIMVVIAAAALVLILLAVVVVAIRQEPRDTELDKMAPSLIAVIVRRLLGVYLRRPTPPADSTDWQEEWSPDMRSVTARSRPSDDGR